MEIINRLKVADPAIQSITAMLNKWRETKEGTVGDLVQDLKYFVMNAKMQNLSDDEIAALPIVYWNCGNRRAGFSLTFCDRRESAKDLSQPYYPNHGKELAELPTDFYMEIFDPTLPLFDKDTYEDEDEGEA